MGEGKRQPDPSSQPRRKAAVFFIDSSEEFVGWYRLWQLAKSMIERKFGDATLEYAKRRRVEKEATEFAANPKDAVLAARLRKSVDLIPMLPFPVTLWDVQNICYPALVNAFEEKGRGVGGDPAMQHHFDNLVHLAEQLRIRAPQLELQP